MLIYLSIGVLLVFVMELLATKGKVGFNNLERIIIIVGWPIWLIKLIQKYL